MATPISFGDAYLMGKLAFRLGQAFTKGRKSAPAELREVEGQLYSLSKALDALDKSKINTSTSQPGGPQAASLTSVDDEDTILPMLQSCKECLGHLEAIVKKYSCITESRDAQQPRHKRWTSDFKKNWKKIQWTTEGGDLGTLRSQLTTHTNALNLVLGVATNLQTSLLMTNAEQTNEMLREIHEWFVHNLKDTTTQAAHSVIATTAQQASDPPLREISFELLLDCGSGRGLIPICGCASLHPSLSIKSSSDEKRQLFVCRCGSAAQGSDRRPHTDAIAPYTLSQQTYPVRLAGDEQSWMVYRATDSDTNRVVSLRVRNISLHGIAEFEQSFVQRLAYTRAAAILHRGDDNMLAHVDTETQVRRCLDLVVDVNGAHKSINSVTFSSGRHKYRRASIQEIQVLHYRAFDDAMAHERRHQHTAELVIFFDDENSKTPGDISRVVLSLTSTTEHMLDPDEATVLIKGIICSGLGKDDLAAGRANSVDVAIDFAAEPAAKDFHQKLHDMIMELFVIDLQFPRPIEATVLSIHASQVRSRDVDIPDADITIVQNTKTQAFRMIIASSNGCSILSQKPGPVPPDFLDSLSRRSGPNLRSAAYWVQIERNGKRAVTLCKQGFERLEFSHTSNNRLFELGLATIAGALPGTDT